MSAALSRNWDDAYTPDSVLAAAVVTNGSTQLGDEIILDGKSAVEISVTVTYGGTASAPAEVYLCRKWDDMSFEAYADNPFGFAMAAYTVSTTHHRVETVSAAEFDRFKVMVRNPTGASVTVTVRYRYATDQSV